VILHVFMLWVSLERAMATGHMARSNLIERQLEVLARQVA
jgi:hypothetical protein